MNKIIYYSLVVITLFLWACNNTQPIEQPKKQRVFPGYNVVLDDIIKTKDGVIRGLNLNSRTDSIIKKEQAVPTERDTNYLYFEFKIDSVTNYSVTYNLQNDSLDEVEIQINCTDIDLSTDIFNDLKRYYEQKLPNPTEDKGFVVYNCFEGERKPFVVSLTDNSTPALGIINLVIYRDK